MNILLTILKRWGIESPSNYLVSTEGKRHRSTRDWLFCSTEEMEAEFAELRYL